jgi:N-glycosylase/DNA lyase
MKRFGLARFGFGGRADRLPGMDYERACEELMKLSGVGEKIAACTLLFSCGHDDAFPIDVWVERSLCRLCVWRSDLQSRPKANRTVANSICSYTLKQLRTFARSHFGPYAGWARQDLFVNERTRARNRAEGFPVHPLKHSALQLRGRQIGR